MSSTDAHRPRTFRTAAARTVQVGALVLAVTATLPLAASTAHADPAPGEPTCQDVGADQLGRGDDGRFPIGDTGLVLVLQRSVVSVEGDGPNLRSLTVVTAEGRALPGWGSGADLHGELNAPTYDHVRVCWEAPATEHVEVPETTPTTVPWTDVEEPSTTPWTQVTERPGTTPTATVPTKRSTAATDTKWSTILEPTDEPSTPVDRKRSTPTTTQEPTTPPQEPTTPAANLAQPEVPGDVTEAADSTPAPSATTQPAAAAQVRTATPSEAPVERLVQTGAETMPLVVASTSLVVLGGVLVHLSRPSRRPAARRRSVR
ncbi:hypothetical protein ACFP63_16810 [Oerskovia jenensis]|uniref:LPXTG-motif cell wall-anchored protein n=1 Tax=Oerskovia jenensis TaxID=162169 RepID=A0ABS2LG84_9CELL|nr:hypothetical protein [Oerskovia jenensis]MBM7479436.1 hypothetical protein [Oerskovia jenensis]